MRRPFTLRRAVSSAALTAVACALAPALVFGGASAADALTLSSSLASADDVTPVIVDPTAAPDPDPSPTSAPDPTPDPTDEPAPTTPPTSVPEPTVDPTVPPAPPTQEPAPATEIPAPVEPVPTEEPSEEPAPVPDESDSGSESDDDSGEETETPVPTETPAPAPAPVVTATAAPVPAIELPFYPPPSAGTAHDTFPFLLAGILAALVLILGFATYIFTRWRVRRLKGPVRSRRRVAFPGSGNLSGLADRLPTGSAIAAGFALPWASASRPDRNEVGSDFALGFSPLAARDDAIDRASLLDTGFSARDASTSNVTSATDFALPFARDTEAGATDATDRTADLQVFDKPKTTRDQAASFASRFGLPFGRRGPAAPIVGGGNYDMGLPSTS